MFATLRRFGKLTGARASWPARRRTLHYGNIASRVWISLHLQRRPSRHQLLEVSFAFVYPSLKNAFMVREGAISTKVALNLNWAMEAFPVGPMLGWSSPKGETWASQHQALYMQAKMLLLCNQETGQSQQLVAANLGHTVAAKRAINLLVICDIRFCWGFLITWKRSANAPLMILSDKSDVRS